MLRLRVVLYQEDGLWVAHSLEMDVIGVGETQEFAIEELKGNIEAQLSFAKFSNFSPFREAPASVQKLWVEANQSALGLVKENKKASPLRTEFLEWTQRQVSMILGSEYQCA